MQRVVIDTNALISRLLAPQSVVASAIRKAVDSCVVIASEATLAELLAVLGKAKFDSYITSMERQDFFKEYLSIIEIIPVAASIKACRDPDDDKFLDIAVQGDADYLITGDSDLLDLHPFMGVHILSPSAFLNHKK